MSEIDENIQSWKRLLFAAIQQRVDLNIFYS